MKKNDLTPPSLQNDRATPSILDITEESCRERFMAAIRDYIGPGKTYNYQQASDALGIDKRTIENYVLGDNMPPFPKLARMWFLFGNDFANRLLRIAGLDGCRRQQVMPISDFELNGDVATMIGDLGQALRNGKIPPREFAHLLKDACFLYDALGDWIAEHDALPGQKPSMAGRTATPLDQPKGRA